MTPQSQLKEILEKLKNGEIDYQQSWNSIEVVLKSLDNMVATLEIESVMDDLLLSLFQMWSKVSSRSFRMD
jgi:uncharacterized protein YpuA (DUF1002 family)